MHPVRKLFLILACVVLTFGVAVGGEDVLESETVYDLTAGSAFVEGCFEPCQCPIRISSDLDGEFVLRPTDAYA